MCGTTSAKKGKVTYLYAVLLSISHQSSLFTPLQIKEIPITVSEDIAVSPFLGLNASVISSRKRSCSTHTHLCKGGLDAFLMFLPNVLFLILG